MPARRSTILWIILIITVSVAVYLPTLGGDFALDDWGLIVYDTSVHSLRNIPSTFFADFLRGLLGESLTYYRPLITVSYQINYALSGLNPAGFRFTNILLSALIGVMVFFVTKKMLKSAVPAGVAGVAFATLPSHAESVAWISGRTDVMAALFTLASVMAFAANYALRPRQNRMLLFLCSFFFLCALLSKENSLVLPVLLAAYVWVFGERPKRKEILTWGLAVIPPLVIYLLLRKYVLGTALCSGMWLLLEQRLLCIGVTYAVYLRMMFVPQQVHVVYDVFPIALKYPIVAAAAWLIPLGLAAFAVWTRKKVPVISFSLLWIFITILPVTNLLPTIGPLPTERFVYMGSIGSSVILGWLVWRLYQFKPKSLQLWPALVICLTCGYFLYAAAWAIHGSQYYASDVAWAREVTATRTRFLMFRAGAAKIYTDAGLLQEAASEYEEVLTMRQNDLTDYVSLSRIYRRMKEPQKALDVLERGKSKIGPSAPLEYHTGITYAEMGDMKKAESAFEKAVQINPKLAPAWRNLGKTRFKQGKFSQAAEAYKKALKLAKPGSDLAEKVREELQKTINSDQ